VKFDVVSHEWMKILINHHTVFIVNGVLGEKPGPTGPPAIEVIMNWDGHIGLAFICKYPGNAMNE
jgi:hypothetical protein